MTGYSSSLVPVFLETLISTVHSFLALLGKTPVTSPNGHSFLCNWPSLRRTMLPISRCDWFPCHFLCGCSEESYCFLHLSQKVWARCWTWNHGHLNRSIPLKSLGGAEGRLTFCVSSVVFVNNSGSSGSEDLNPSNLALMIADTSAMSVVSTSCVSLCDPCRNMESRIFLAMPIILSQCPPMWEAWEGLKCQM